MGERAVLVTVNIEQKSNTANDGWAIEDYRAELYALAVSAGAEVVSNLVVNRKTVTPDLFIGKGKTFEISQIAKTEKADVVIFSEDLSPTQQRNLENAIEVRVVDRTQLILDIFASRAKSVEGKIQVELAQLMYLSPRLVGKGITLSQLGSGIGTRGPGETQLEIDKRRIRKHVEQLKDVLSKMTQRRKMLQESRKEHMVTTAVLVGYTNAGKSTLLNLLTDAHTLVKDKLFSTLDSLSRQLTLPNKQNVMVIDTVGFLHKLPHHLIESFKATLEEVVDADIIVHVLDVSNKCHSLMAEAVLKILTQLKASDKPVITVLNKIDKVTDKQILSGIAKKYDNSVTMSSTTGEGKNVLVDKLVELTSKHSSIFKVFVPLEKQNIVSVIYDRGRVINRENSDNGIVLEIDAPKQLEHFLRKENIITNEN